MTTEQLRTEIKEAYHKFFAQMSIDPHSGFFTSGSPERLSRKFATMPHIGGKHCEAKKRILVIGMDIGSDETPQTIQSYDERQQSIEKECNFFNAHIAGTYCTALYLLKEAHHWEEVWQKVAQPGLGYETATKTQNHRNGENPLSHIALTNLWKFVTKGRQALTGDADRIFLDQGKEEGLLLKEIEILKPHIIVLQSQEFPNDVYAKLPHKTAEGEKITYYKAYHPSAKGAKKTCLEYANAYLKPLS